MDVILRIFEAGVAAGEAEVQLYMVQEAKFPLSRFKGSYYMYDSSQHQQHS
jgi:hypothetical protein